LGPGKGPDPIAVHEKCPARALYIIIWHDFFYYIYTGMIGNGNEVGSYTNKDRNLKLSEVVGTHRGRVIG